MHTLFIRFAWFIARTMIFFVSNVNRTEIDTSFPSFLH